MSERMGWQAGLLCNEDDACCGDVAGQSGAMMLRLRAVSGKGKLMSISM